MKNANVEKKGVKWISQEGKKGIFYGHATCRQHEALLDLIRVAADEGYNYIAQDPDDLVWYAYENLPRYTGSLWNTKGRYKELIGTRQMMPAEQSLTKISDILDK